MVIAQLVQPLLDEAQTALAILEMGTQQSRLRADHPRRPHGGGGGGTENGTNLTSRDKDLDSTAAAKCWSFATCQKLTEHHRSMDNDAYKPLAHEPVHVSGAPLASAESMKIDSKSDDAPSVVAGAVVGTWKNGSLKRPDFLPMMPAGHASKDPQTPAFTFDQTPTPGIKSKSVTSIYTDSTCETSEYHLSEHSQDMLMNIIRCFPFPTPKNSPKVVKRLDSKVSLPGCIVEPSSSSVSTPESPSYTTQSHEQLDPTKPPSGKKHYFAKHQATVANLFHRQHHAVKQQQKRAAAHSGADFGSATSTETISSNGRPPALSSASAPGSVGAGESTSSPDKEVKKSALSRLCQVSVDTMAITALPLDCWLKERLKKWVQLSGHEGTIVPATNQTLWKKQPNHNTIEARAYEEIMRDENLAGMTPKYFKEIEHKNESFIEIQDLLSDFPNVSTRAIMDIKIGKRTFLEDEVSNMKKRADLYRKMIDIDPNEPTEEEREEQAITKMRYMQFRERESSSASLGFRIEAAQHPSGKLQKSFKKVHTRDQVVETLKTFLGDRVDEASRELEERLRQIRAGVERSEFFRTHEVVGSSVLLIYDHEKAGAWMIDFAKSKTVDSQLSLDHRSDWQIGNHEDGYLVGLDNLIEILSECHS